MRSKAQTALATVDGFSQRAVSRSVLHNTLQHPLSLYPAVLGVLGVAATLVFGLSYGALLTSFATLGGGVMSWIVNYFFRGEVFARRYIQACQKALESQKHELLEDMQIQLKQCLSISGAEDLAWQGTEQLDQIQTRYATLQEVLEDKLDRGELSYGRYLGVAEQVYLSVLDNLQSLIPILKSAGAMDSQYDSRRLSELQSRERPDDADREEMETLTQRQGLRERQLQKASVLLTRNEEAMTHMDDAIANIANMDTEDARGSAGMETAIEELQRLARVTQQFK